MRNVAVLINERKRRMESLEKLAAWQQRVEGWEVSHTLFKLLCFFCSISIIKLKLFLAEIKYKFYIKKLTYFSTG